MTRMSDEDELSEHVRTLVCSILRQANFLGSDQLIEQASTVVVAGGPITMLDLRPNPEHAASAFTSGPIPVSVEVLDVSGSSIGELLVWVNAGRLSALEFGWWTDERPDQLPHPSQLKIIQK
ncbi:hypothetical protein ACIQTZ_11785 [Paenarthrobacter sp. NPDC090520]|uniref:hypothetical protein n=1 Tax=Paenarthrobacter sp. NPDC090520 TaxID=3364382 RepID=UPI0037F56BA0